jgi:hypothetical protein
MPNPKERILKYIMSSIKVQVHKKSILSIRTRPLNRPMPQTQDPRIFSCAYVGQGFEFGPKMTIRKMHRLPKPAGYLLLLHLMVGHETAMAADRRAGSCPGRRHLL